jgi:D-alanine-D-alanine ligase
MNVQTKAAEYDVDSMLRWQTRSGFAPRRVGRTDELNGQVATLLSQMNIAVIYGGDKSATGAVIHQTSNPRSWKSYRNVAEDIAGALQRLGCPNVQLLADDMSLGDELRRHQIHFAWLNTGGVQGYSPMSHTAAMLEMFGIPYVGHDPLAAGMLDNKIAFKRELMALGIRTAPFVAWHPSRGRFDPHTNAAFNRVFPSYDGPFVVKPVSGRASLHVHYVQDCRALADTVAKVFWATKGQVLIEKFLPGAEYCVAVSGPIVAQNRQLAHRGEPFAFSFVERVLDEGEVIFTSMDIRPITMQRLRVLEPQNDADLIAGLREVARSVYVELELESIIRLDVRKGTDDQLYVIEANPKPDLKKPTPGGTSIACAGLPACGMDFDDLILSLFADRVDILFSQRRGCTTHLSSLID